MAEHHNGPVELGAPMDYPEHEKTYDFFIAATDAADPMVKGFAVIAIFILPNIQAELILCTEPFLFVHNLPPPLHIANA